MLYSKLAKPFLFKMDPEKAHHLVIDGLHTASRIPGVPAAMRAMYGVTESKELAVDAVRYAFSASNWPGCRS